MRLNPARIVKDATPLKEIPSKSFIQNRPRKDLFLEATRTGRTKAFITRHHWFLIPQHPLQRRFAGHAQRHHSRPVFCNLATGSESRSELSDSSRSIRLSIKLHNPVEAYRIAGAGACSSRDQRLHAWTEIIQAKPVACGSLTYAVMGRSASGVGAGLLPSSE